jgi:hypothetical protein
VVSSNYFVSPIAGATAYEWQISPQNAGTVSWNNENATVTWNPAFIGPATLVMRVTVNGVVSEWSRLDVKVVLNTKLLSQTSDTATCTAKPISLFVGAEGISGFRTVYLNNQEPLRRYFSLQPSLQIQGYTTVR